MAPVHETRGGVVQDLEGAALQFFFFNSRNESTEKGHFSIQTPRKIIFQILRGVQKLLRGQSPPQGESSSLLKKSGCEYVFIVVFFYHWG